MLTEGKTYAISIGENPKVIFCTFVKHESGCYWFKDISNNHFQINGGPATIREVYHPQDAKGLTIGKVYTIKNGELF
tara:strand:- start:858 stop:1088 length:231 start_codon:yes stop_codon:yes gene_type:complete